MIFEERFLHRMRDSFNQAAIENPKSITQVPGGTIELPTKPEGFRGCSTAANGKVRVLDSSFALINPQSPELRRESILFSWQQFSSVSPSRFVVAVWSRKCCPNRAFRSTVEPMQYRPKRRGGYRPEPYTETARGENRTPDQGLMSPLLYR